MCKKDQLLPDKLSNVQNENKIYFSSSKSFSQVNCITSTIAILVILLNVNLMAQEYAFKKEISCFEKDQSSFQYNAGLSSLAIDKRDNIYIHDLQGGTIIKLDSSRLFIKKWNSFDYEENKRIKDQNPTDFFEILKNGKSIKTDHTGNVYLFGYRSIHKFNSDGIFIKSLKPIMSFNDIAFDSLGNIYGLTSGSILKLDSNGHEIETIHLESAIFNRTTTRSFSSLVMNNNGDFYVMDEHLCKIFKYNNKGQFIISFGEKGHNDGELYRGGQLAIDYLSNIYVCDGHNQRIQCFDSEGQYKFRIGSDKNTRDKIIYPHSIVIDTKGNILIQSQSNGIIEYNKNREYITTLGTDGRLEGCFKSPSHLFISNDSLIYVVDSGKPTIQRFNLNGDFKDVFLKTKNLDGSPLGVQDICEDKNGNILLLTYNQNDPIITLNTDGYYITRRPSNTIDKFRNKTILDIGKNNGRKSYYVAGRDSKNVLRSRRGYPTSYIESFVDLPEDSYVVDFVVNKEEEITIAFWNHSIQKFDKDGNFIDYVIKPEKLKDYNFYFQSIAVDERGNTFCLLSDCTILKHSASGELLCTIDLSGKMKSCSHSSSKIAVTKNGKRCFITDKRSFRILVYEELRTTKKR